MTHRSQKGSGTDRSASRWPTKKLRQARTDVRLREQLIAHVHLDYPERLRKRIGELAFRINGHLSADIYFDFFAELEVARNLLEPKKPAGARSTRWADELWAYLYPDGVGGFDRSTPSTLDGITENLDYYTEKLGARVLYVLPLTRSPNRDGRYDVSGYRSVDPPLGGDEAFFRLIKEARARDAHVVMDLIPAHVSEEHPWFKKALAGHPRYLDYFLWTDSPPEGKLVAEPDGNSWMEYVCPTTSSAYRRLLLFPDLSRTHWIPEKVTVDGKTTTRWFYSSFFPFQKDLDLQNPNVIREHLETIGYWLSHGVSGIRADALPWWIKLAGHSGQHAEETGFLCELLHRFIKLTNPEAILLPELVESTRLSVHYLGEQKDLGDPETGPVITGSRSDTVFAFERTVHILYATVSGDFAHWHENMFESGSGSGSGSPRHLPENTRLVYYTGNHHDEIYLGFLPDEPKKDFHRRIVESGGVVYKNGNSGGAMVTNLLDHDPARIHGFHKFLFGHYGTMAVYQGTELGLENNWPHALETTIAYLDALKQKDLIRKDHPVFDEIARIRKIDPTLEHTGPLAAESPLTSFIDGRLLHRNRVTDPLIENAKRGENPVFESIRRIARIRYETPALRDGGPERPLRTMRRDIGSFVRRACRPKAPQNPKNTQTHPSQEVAVIQNGTPKHTEVDLSLEDLTEKDSFVLWELEENRAVAHTLHRGSTRKDSYVTIDLFPHQTAWLEIRANPKHIRDSHRK
jgi:glycosidase